MGLIFNKEPPKSNCKPSSPSTCIECKAKRIEKKMLMVGIKLCRDCYTLRKKEYLKRDVECTSISQINEITPKLYLGNNQTAKQKDDLHQLGITHILVCGYYLHEYYPNDFIYKTVEIEDHKKERLLTHLFGCIEFIQNATKIYVHCRAGISRSSSMVIGYLMFENKWTYSQAKEYVLNRRGEIEPNTTFEADLMKFDELIQRANYKPDIIKTFLIEFE